ncbi:MAG: uL22 family ribosomal protein, partial [Candidatus Bipolaricaulia bacterium]
KRVKPRARGSADLIRHRTSHITVILSDEWEEEEGEEE